MTFVLLAIAIGVGTFLAIAAVLVLAAAIVAGALLIGIGVTAAARVALRGTRRMMTYSTEKPLLPLPRSSRHR